MSIKKEKGFTLAEVLITLGIIGVVAALTIPVITANVTKKQNLIAFKKKYVEISEAIKLSTINNSKTSAWDYTLSDEEFFTKYIAPYLKTTKCDNCWISFVPKGLWFESPAYAAPSMYEEECYNYKTIDEVTDEYFECRMVLQECIETNGNPYYYPELCQAWLGTQTPANSTPPDEPAVTYAIINGNTLGMAKSDSFFYLYLDVNGKAKPNKYGADRFVLKVSNSNVLPYGYGLEDLTTGEFGCSSEGNGMYCGAMIMQNNWEYPDNYTKL